EQVGNDDAHTLARTGRRGKDRELLPRQTNEVAVELADDQARVRFLEHALPGQVAGAREARVPVQGLLRRLEDQDQQQDAGKQRRAEAEVTGGPDPPRIGCDLRQVDGLDVRV